MTEHSMDNSRIIELIAKKTDKSASSEELAELALLLSENPSYSYLAEIVESLKGNKEHFEKNVPGPELAETGWRQLSRMLRSGTEPMPGAAAGAEEHKGKCADPHINARSRFSRMTSLCRIAAAIIVTAGAVGVWYYPGSAGRSNHAFVNKSLNVKYGRRSQLLLGDGTKVWLNAGSRLEYPEVFSGSAREVTLQGEAYFDVAQQANTPFLVHAGKITVKVLGTQFDVEDAELSTTLISGKVQVVLNDDPEKNIILSSREKLTVSSKMASSDRSADTSFPDLLKYKVQALPVVGHDSLLETAWLENKLVFSNQTFEGVARLLERKYDVQITFSDESLRQEHLSGVFEKEGIEQALEILKMTTRFRYTINGNQIRLAIKR